MQNLQQLITYYLDFCKYQKLFQTAYQLLAKAATPYQERVLSRDIAVLELLFSTGLRVSELCSLNCNDIDLEQGSVRIYGKGSKERTFSSVIV